ncbi:MAG: hypothetical protein CL610_16070 [Anaerolineaceae bacterium]|nr:hypothetical protein [Anaerolineaceae bacterium]
MNELVERYVHQVGRYLPQKERAEIEAELRSLIQDQLDDRYEGIPSQADVAAVLTELGEPRQMAASYGSEQYLVGPALYPYMMMILRRGLLIVPTIVAFLNGFEVLIAETQTTVWGLLLATVFGALQATFIFSGIVVMIFAIVQHSGADLEENKEPFNPLDLPKVDDPISVDRFEIAFGLVFGVFFTLVLLYFLRVGGLTLHLNLNDPGEVIPVPTSWLILLIVISVVSLIINLIVLRRNYWGPVLWLTETVLEVAGAVCLYFVLYQPIFERIVVAVPALADAPIPQSIVVISAVVTLVTHGIKLVQLTGGADRNRSAFTMKAGG